MFDLRKASAKDFLFEIYNQIKLCETGGDFFKDRKRIFIIPTAPVRVLQKFLQALKAINPQIFTYILIHESDKNAVAAICENNYELISYTGGANYDVRFMRDRLDYLKTQPLDSYLYFINNKYGIGFENIEEIMLQLTDHDIHVADNDGKIYVISNPQQHVASQHLFQSLVDWFWEYMGEVNV